MNHSSFVLLLTLVSSVLTCQSSEQASSSVEALPTPAVSQLRSMESPNDHWMQAWNTRSDSLANLYTENALRITPRGLFLEGPSAILADSKRKGFSIDSIKTQKKLFANRRENYSYEIGTFWTDEPAQYQQLVIWKNEATGPLRELEIIVPTAPSSDLTAILDARRADWIKRCNEHNAERLVRELYAPNALYYNHRPMITGRDAITQEYQYMNNPDYQLHLEPIIVSAVRPNLAFEIGQCSGSYGGKYVIVWQKGGNDQWYVMMDSNI